MQPYPLISRLMIRPYSRLSMRTVRSLIISIALVLSTSVPGWTQTRPILRVGSQGATVTELQSTLKLLGYFSGSVNGAFEESTDQAVKRFQQAAGITADGVVGNETWNRLFPTSEPTTLTPAPRTPEARPVRSEPAPTGAFPILRRGARGEAVQGLQSRLRAIGMYDGEVDGVFGAGTEAAVKAAQAKFGLAVDGVVGGATWAAILR
ncbi:peptidoglycan-binding protein [Leptolyngbya sp. FACHB-17]|uniref:peptidoglycan-binding domain-containing protein n=2 Tax=unclassified Leptolyngbya TaxID=2650499 RepID=UPI001A7EF04B|nr:peptidoglycan-binding protein [Leptolyngbya sp. FACHB-17]